MTARGLMKELPLLGMREAAVGVDSTEAALREDAHLVTGHLSAVNGSGVYPLPLRKLQDESHSAAWRRRKLKASSDDWVLDFEGLQRTVNILHCAAWQT